MPGRKPCLPDKRGVILDMVLSDMIAKEIKQLQIKEANLLQRQKDGNQQEKIVSRLIPATQHILENYTDLSIGEKNQLWKLVMKKATVYRSQDDALTVEIYPSVPK